MIIPRPSFGLTVLTRLFNCHPRESRTSSWPSRFSTKQVRAQSVLQLSNGAVGRIVFGHIEGIVAHLVSKSQMLTSNLYLPLTGSKQARFPPVCKICSCGAYAEMAIEASPKSSTVAASCEPGESRCLGCWTSGLLAPVDRSIHLADRYLDLIGAKVESSPCSEMLGVRSRI